MGYTWKRRNKHFSSDIIQRPSCFWSKRSLNDGAVCSCFSANSGTSSDDWLTRTFTSILGRSTKFLYLRWSEHWLSSIRSSHIIVLIGILDPVWSPVFIKIVFQRDEKFGQTGISLTTNVHEFEGQSAGFIIRSIPTTTKPPNSATPGHNDIGSPTVHWGRNRHSSFSTFAQWSGPLRGALLALRRLC